jgi:hypothetical protein
MVLGALVQRNFDVLIPFGGGQPKARLRLQPARNNQKRNIRLVSDYEIDCWTIEALCDVAASGGSRARAALSFA